MTPLIDFKIVTIRVCTEKKFSVITEIYGVSTEEVRHIYKQ
ncbi:MAG: hypothetical protein QNJ65_17780 [Xenococcaceae cyanobacterium MO_234.B1]|nr:hypothetical protein [Xenococcaceae cyanobacterium MO_234.B1]